MMQVITPRLYIEFNEQYFKCFDKEEHLIESDVEDRRKLINLARDLNNKFHVLDERVTFGDYEDGALNVISIPTLHRLTV
jgi:hypothetical protein